MGRYLGLLPRQSEELHRRLHRRAGDWIPGGQVQAQRVRGAGEARGQGYSGCDQAAGGEV